MKKLLVIVSSAVMILSLTAAAFGAVNVSGEAKVKYIINENQAGDNKKDEAEAKVKFESQINEKLSANVIAKAKISEKTGSSEVKVDNAGKVTTTKGTNFYCDEYFATYKDTFGNIKVGYFGFKTKGNVDILDPAVKDLKSVTGIEYTSKIAEVIDLGVFYTPDYHNHDEELEDNAFAVRLGSNVGIFGGEIAVVNTNQDNTEMAYALNLNVTPVEGLTIYTHYGVDQCEDVVTIIGGVYTVGRLSARLEYNLNDNMSNVNDSLNQKMENNLYGIKLCYKADHGVEYEVGHKNKEVDKGNEQTSETYVSAKVKL